MTILFATVQSQIETNKFHCKLVMNIYKVVQATKLSASNIYTSYPVFQSHLQTTKDKKWSSQMMCEVSPKILQYHVYSCKNQAHSCLDNVHLIKETTTGCVS